MKLLSFADFVTRTPQGNYEDRLRSFRNHRHKLLYFLLLLSFRKLPNLSSRKDETLLKVKRFQCREACKFTDLRRILLIIIYLPGDRSNYTVRRSAYILDNYSMHILTIRRLVLWIVLSGYLLYCKCTSWLTITRLKRNNRGERKWKFYFAVFRDTFPY